MNVLQKLAALGLLAVSPPTLAGLMTITKQSLELNSLIDIGYFGETYEKNFKGSVFGDRRGGDGYTFLATARDFENEFGVQDSEIVIDRVANGRNGRPRDIFAGSVQTRLNYLGFLPTDTSALQPGDLFVEFDVENTRGFSDGDNSSEVAAKLSTVSTFSWLLQFRVGDEALSYQFDGSGAFSPRVTSQQYARNLTTGTQLAQFGVLNPGELYELRMFGRDPELGGGNRSFGSVLRISGVTEVKVLAPAPLFLLAGGIFLLRPRAFGLR